MGKGISNLEARKEDYLASGLDEMDATEKAKESITEVGDLIEGCQTIYYKRFRMESLQSFLLYIVIVWILTMPGRFFDSGRIINDIILLIFLCAGLVYLIYCNAVKKSENTEEYLKQQKVVDSRVYQRRKRIAWLIWWIYIFVRSSTVTLIYFTVGYPNC